MTEDGGNVSVRQSHQPNGGEGRGRGQGRGPRADGGVNVSQVIFYE